MVTARAEAIRARADRLAASLRAAGIACEVVASEAAVGGGAFPTLKLESAAVAINGKAEQVEEQLRLSSETVVGRIVDGQLLLDLRSILPEQDDAFAAAVLSALRA
jgi:L-seryl-tRNA(Ser) seleniumtransferase